MAGIGRPANQACKHAILAVARAHALHPACNMPKAKELATRIDALAREATTADAVVALSLLLLRAIGILDDVDESRLLSSSAHGN